jgi:hypothetical protein
MMSSWAFGGEAGIGIEAGGGIGAGFGIGAIGVFAEVLLNKVNHKLVKCSETYPLFLFNRRCFR